MGKHMMFLRWWLLVILMTLGGFMAFKANLFHDMWCKDATTLSFVNLAILFLFTIKCGIATWKTSGKFGELSKIETSEETGWFWSAQVLSIGMFGTVCGFIMMLEGAFGHADFSDPLLAQTVLPKMVMGISTALYTTLTGLLASVLLKIQYYNLSLGIKKLREEHGK